MLSFSVFFFIVFATKFKNCGQNLKSKINNFLENSKATLGYNSAAHSARL